MENATLNDIRNELRTLNKKFERLENILIREVEPTAADIAQREEAIDEHKAGKTVKFRDIRKN